MAKGMSMEEFRAGLASEATKENDELKTKIQKMDKTHRQIVKELNEEIEKYKKYFNSLTNRCFAQTHGVICSNCMIEECKYSMQPEMERAAEYMSKHGLPRNNETLKKLSELMNEWWKERIFGKGKGTVDGQENTENK